jgi:cytochrome oxidase Cu insertion factor (SCO1/SenC/PrrC family)
MAAKHVAALLLAIGVLASSPPVAADQPAVKRATPVGAGDTAPDFTLADQDGHKQTLSAERGKRPVVLVFYRGHW